MCLINEEIILPYSALLAFNEKTIFGKILLRFNLVDYNVETAITIADHSLISYAVTVEIDSSLLVTILLILLTKLSNHVYCSVKFLFSAIYYSIR